MTCDSLPIAILAGGLATRLHPLTETIPKALLEINGEPFLDHQLRLLRAAGLRRVVLCVGHLGESIREHVAGGDRFGLHVTCSFDGPTLLGTAGALRRALPLLGPAFFVMYGDSYLPCDYLAVQRAFEDCGRLGLMTVYRNEGVGDASNVEYENGRIIAYDKRNRTPRMRHIDYGLGVLRAAALEALPTDRPADLADLYADLLQQDQLAALEVGQPFYEIGSREGLEGLRRLLTLQDKGCSHAG